MSSLYSKDFCNLIKSLKAGGKPGCPDSPFVGMGNPDSQILFIGKECDQTTDSGNPDYCRSKHSNKLEIQNNLLDWEYNIAKSVNFSGVNTSTIPWDNAHQLNNLLNWNDRLTTKAAPIFNPLWPYKNIPLTGSSHFQTWHNYQKIIDKKFHNNSSNVLDFWEKAFITELNQEVGKSSGDVFEKNRCKSIKNRLAALFKNPLDPFFKHFSTVIMNCETYVRDYHLVSNGILQPFGAKFKKSIPVCSKSGRVTTIDIYDSYNQRIIVTRQLSGAFPRALLDEIAKNIK